MKKKAKIILGILGGFSLLLSLAVAVPFLVLGVRTQSIQTDWAVLKQDPHYSQKAEVEGLSLVNQHVSCGYASIQMLSDFYGQPITEDELEEKNGGAISTSSTEGFLREINSSIPSKSFEKKTYLENSAYLKTIHDSLAKGHPIAIEWAAQREGEWTLHFSVVSSLSIQDDAVVVYNPYGYIEELSVGDFLSRTSFEAYQGMPLFLQFGFAYGAFDKNACFPVL